LLATLANIIMVFYLYFKVDLDEPKPLLDIIKYMLNLGNAITNGQATNWFKNNGGLKQQFLYYVLS